MPFPDFDEGKKRLLFFVRGRGRGHAIPDLAIVDKLLESRGDIDVRLVSYATGALAIREHGRPFIDLPLPENGSIPDMTVMAGRLIGGLRPDLVVSHEEFAAVPAAGIFSTPAIALTDWFSGTDRYSMGALRFAEEVIFLGSKGVFDEPPWLAGKTRYVGTILRDFAFQAGDRVRARRELGIEDDALVLSVFPGSWREEHTPFADTVIDAFRALPAKTKTLIWIAGADRDLIAGKTSGMSDVILFDHYREIDRLMASSDAAITKTNRKTVFELRHLNVPTVAVTYGLNPPDDVAVSSLAGVTRLDGFRLTTEELRATLERLIGNPPPPDTFAECPVGRCAELLGFALDRATGSR